MKAWSMSQGKVVDVPDSTSIIYDPRTKPGAGDTLTAYQQYQIGQDTVGLQKKEQDAAEKKKADDDAVASYTDQVFNQTLPLTGVKEEYQSRVADEVKKKGGTPLSKEQINWNSIDKDMKSAAVNAKTRMEPILSGQVTGQEAKDLMKTIASEYNKEIFKISGKALTEGEKSVLQGIMVPTKGEYVPNLFERLMGGYYKKPPSGEVVVDKPEEMVNIFSRVLGEAPVSSRSEEKGVKGFINNAGQDIVDTGKGVYDLLKLGVKANPQNNLLFGKSQNQLTDQNKEAMGQMIQVAAGMPGAVANEYKNLIIDPNTGKFDIGQFGKQAYEHPVNTALDVLPFLNMGKNAIAPTINKMKSGVASSLEKSAGEFATSVFVPDKNSVVKSEKLAAQSLLNTKPNTVRGMARELETSIPKDTALINAKLAEVDKVIGPQDLDEVVSGVIEKISNSSEAQANPQLLKQVELDLRKRLAGDTAPGSGALQGTTLSNIDKARKDLNSSLSDWYKNMSPVGSPTNDLNSLKSQAAKALKDIELQPDAISADVKAAIDRQHTAISTYPILSNKAFENLNSSGQFSFLFKHLTKLTEPIKVGSARAMQKTGPLQQFLSQPTKTANSSAMLNFSPLIPAATQQRY